MGSCFGRCISKETHTHAATSCLWRHTTDEQADELMSNASDKCPQRESLIFRIIKFKTKQKRPQFIDKFWEQKDLNYTKLNNKNNHESISDIQLQNLDVHNLLNTAALAKESVLNCTPGTQTAVLSSRASSSLDLEWEHEYAHMLRSHYAPPMPAHAGALTIQQQNEANSSNNADNNNSNHSCYDNHMAGNLHGSWQFLNHDDEQLNSLASGSQSLSLAAPVNIVRSSRGYGKVMLPRNGSFTRTASTHNSWSHISTPESLEWDQDEEQQRQLRVEDDNLDHETLELLHQIEQLKNRVLDETGDGLFENGEGEGLGGELNEGNELKTTNERLMPNIS